jgi:hypothetical protein
LTALHSQVCVLVRASGSVSRSSMAAARQKQGICSMVLAVGVGLQCWQSGGGSAAAAREQWGSRVTAFVPVLQYINSFFVNVSMN